MTEKEILLSHITDKILCSENSFMITNSDFLSVDEKSDVLQLARQFNASIDTVLYGGFHDAERTVAIFIPKYFSVDDESIFAFLKENPDYNPISVVKITKDRFSEVSHRDYLGSIMGLGIKRSMLGDILVFDWGAYVFCTNKISGYICDNLNKCGRSAVICSIVADDSFELPEEKSELHFHSVASMRLDNIVAAGFGVSRTVCNDAIRAGLIFVNSVKAEKSDMKLKTNDKIVFRGKGKIIIAEHLGQSKKNRIHINIKHFR